MGKKNKCPMPNTEGYLEASKNDFQNIFNRIIEKQPDLKDNEAGVVSLMYNSFLSESNELADAFSVWASEKFPDYSFQDNLRAPSPTTTEASRLSALIDNDIQENYDDTYDIEELEGNEEGKEGEHRDYTSTLNDSTKNVHIRDSGESHFKTILFKALDRTLSKSEYEKIVDNARNLDFDSFLHWLVREENYPELGIEEAINVTENKLRQLKQFHISKRPENSRSRKQKKEWLISNFDGKNILPRGILSMIKKPPMNLKTKKQEPGFKSASFIDISKNKLGSGKTLGQSTEYISIKDIVEFVEKKDKTWYVRDIHDAYNPKLFHDWLKIMLDEKGLTIASIKGGNSGTVMLTPVDAAYYEILFPKEVIKNLVEEGKFPEKFVPWLEKRNYDFNKAIKAYYKSLLGEANRKGMGMIRDEVALYNWLEKQQRQMSIKYFSDYLDGEIEKNNIDDATKKVFLRNITELPLKGVIDKVTGMSKPYMFMGEYLASIIARHEWKKASIGNDYAMRGETTENIFNRMRLAASEGIVDRDASPTIDMTINQDKVYFRYTKPGTDGPAKKINISQDLEGMSTPVDIDDGQKYSDSETIESLTRSVGRYKVFDFEQDPKLIKTVQYVMEQTEEGIPDNYYASKHMLFLAEPGLEIVAKDTDEVVARFVKEVNGDVNIYGGPASPVTGERINTLGSENEVKANTGRFSFEGSNTVQELPPQSTRIIILPSIKSHTDGAGGTTWANKFNMDDKLSNQMRELITEMFVAIADTHIESLHKARLDPDHFRSLVNYMYNIKDDATTAVQQFFEMSDKAIHHPNALKIFQISMFNDMIREASMKGKVTIDKTRPGALSNGMSSSGKLKQDTGGRLRLGKNGEATSVLVGMGNDRTFNYAMGLYIRRLSAKGENVTEFMAKPIEEQMAAINTFLEKNPIKIMINRQPIGHGGAVIIRKVKEFLPDVGDAVVAHIRDVAVHLLGDGDGDTVQWMIPPDRKDRSKRPFIEELDELMNTEAFRNSVKSSADLSKFKHADTTHPASYKGFIETVLSTVKNVNGQGFVTNKKEVASVLELKLGDNPIVFTDGTKIKVIKARDKVVMNYAPLNDNITEKDIPDFAEIVNKDGSPYDGVGEKYLKTTAENERLELLNAATDNTKEHLRFKMWNMTDDNIIKRFFKRTDGREISGQQIKVLTKLMDMFNYSPLRNGLDSKRNKLKPGEWYRQIELLNVFLSLTSEKKAMQIKAGTILRKGKYGIETITISDKLAADEVLLTRPLVKMTEDALKANEGTGQSWGPIGQWPMDYSEAKYLNTHFSTFEGFRNKDDSFKVEGLNKFVWDKLKALKVDAETLDAARDFMIELDYEFIKQLTEGINEKAKFQNDPTVQMYNYDEKMMAFNEKWLPKYNDLVSKHGEAFKVLGTYHAIKGIADTKMKNVFYHPDFFHAETYSKWAEIWEELFFATDPQTGADYVSSSVSKTITDSRVIDVSNTIRSCL